MEAVEAQRTLKRMRTVEGSWSVRFGRSELIYGPGALDRLGEVVESLGSRRPLIVSDPGLREAGHVEHALRVIRARHLDVAVFDAVEPNPTTRHVIHGSAFAEKHATDTIVALGGGSAMDCAKGINFLLTNGGRMEDYWGYGKAGRDMLPSVGVPTTAGTGSEAQSYALISRETTKVKMACGDPKARFAAVILDPVLMGTVPREIAVTTGIDAVSHAVESYVSTARNPISQIFAREAWRLLDASFEAGITPFVEESTRGRMLLAAHLAGAAIDHSMLGAAHACANPLTARYDVIHGAAIGLMLPHVVKFNEAEFESLYAEMHMGTASHERKLPLLQRIEQMCAATGLPRTLRDYAISEGTLPVLARDAAKQWTAGFNPRKVGEPELLELYEAAY